MILIDRDGDMHWLGPGVSLIMDRGLRLCPVGALPEDGILISDHGNEEEDQARIIDAVRHGTQVLDLRDDVLDLMEDDDDGR
jgi:hypothetical protein